MSDAPPKTKDYEAIIEGWFGEENIGYEKIDKGFWGLSFTVREREEEYPLGVVREMCWGFHTHIYERSDDHAHHHRELQSICHHVWQVLLQFGLGVLHLLQGEMILCE